jgi:hypothetical protein
MGETELEVCASAMEAHFDLDASETSAWNDISGTSPRSFRVVDNEVADAATLRRCFWFEFEKSWGDYYDRARLSAAVREKIERHALGTVALDVPVLLAFFLLLGTHMGLPQRVPELDRLNRSRNREGKAPLLDHTEVLAPLLPEYRATNVDLPPSGRRGPRLHHVRGHLVRRRNQLFWRVPHLRGSARSGVVQTRTVTWTFDRPDHLSRQSGNVEH